jgi:DNA-binding NarL/FixJ family response regulator
MPALPRTPKAAADHGAAKKRILVVDDHPFMRAGLSQLIDRQPDLVVCGEAGDPTQALTEFIKDLRALHTDLLILVVSMHDETIYAERVLRAGARGYIMKEAGGDNLLTAIRQVLRGETYVSPGMAARVLDNLSARRPRGSSSPIEKLTDREFEVFMLVGRGKSTRDIAEQLHLSPKTVDVHRSNIKLKLDLTDATALVRHAVRWVEAPGGEGQV